MKIDTVKNLIKFHPVIHVVLTSPEDSFYCIPDYSLFYLWTSEEKAREFIQVNGLPPGEIVACDTERTVDEMKKLYFERLALDFIEEKSTKKFSNHCVIEI